MLKQKFHFVLGLIVMAIVLFLASLHNGRWVLVAVVPLALMYFSIKGTASMREKFYLGFGLILMATLLFLAMLHDGRWFFIVLLPLAMIYAYDVCQKKHAILRNFPILGHIRFLMEFPGAIIYFSFEFFLCFPETLVTIHAESDCGGYPYKYAYRVKPRCFPKWRINSKRKFRRFFIPQAFVVACFYQKSIITGWYTWIGCVNFAGNRGPIFIKPFKLILITDFFRGSKTNS